MANLDQITCLTFKGTSGYGSCAYTPRPKKWLIFAPLADVITAANAVSFNTFLQGKLINDTLASRWHAFGPIVQSEPNGEDVQFDTLPDGTKVPTRDPIFSPIHNIVKGGMCTTKNLFDFDGTQSAYGVFYVDEKGKFLSQATTDSGGDFAAGTHPTEMIYAYPMEDPEYTTAARSRVEITHINPKLDQKNLLIVDMGNTRIDTFFQTYAVQSLTIKDVTPDGAAAGVFHLRLMGSCGNANLAVLYPSAIVTSGLLLPTNGTTGAAITITSVALNAAGDAVVLTLSTADTDYPDAGDPISITTAAVSVLATAGIKYFDNLEPLTVAAT